MTKERPVYILQLVKYNVYWPIIGHLYYMTPFLIATISCFLAAALKIHNTLIYVRWDLKVTLLDLKTLRTNLLNQVRNKDNYVHYSVAD